MLEHMTLDHLIQGAIGLLTAGVSWGVIRGSVRGIEQRLEQHMTATSEWRQSLDQRVGGITDQLLAAALGNNKPPRRR